MTPPSFAEVPDGLLTDILSRASGINQQQEQQQEHEDQEQASAISTRQQQRHLCGIFTRVNHRWRGAALSICTGLDVTLKDLSAVKQLSPWMQRNGNQLQHLSLDFSGVGSVPYSSLSIIPTSTPQLQRLRLRGLDRLTNPVLPSGPISAKGAAAWGGLTRLTSLDIDNMQRFRAPMQHLDYVEELTISDSNDYSLATSACNAVQSHLPRLRLLRLQASRFGYQPLKAPALEILSRNRSLQQVDGMTIVDKDLNHAAVGLLHPSLEIIALSMEPVDVWLLGGGGRKLVNLLLQCCRQPCGSVLAKLQGLPLLRELELSRGDLGAGAQGLQQLTQVTQLRLNGCSPDLTSLVQLPPQLRELSMDNYSGQQQQQQQPEGSTSCLQHLTSLTLSGDKTSDAAMHDFSTLPQLQKLCLMETGAVTVTRGLACLSALQGMTSLTMSRINIGGRQPAEFSVLSSLTSLRHFAVSLPLPAWAALRLVESLAHVPAIHMAVGSPGYYTRSSGGPHEVRLACSGVVIFLILGMQAHFTSGKERCFRWFFVSYCIGGMSTKA